MSIKIGTSDVTDIKIGTTNVNTVYIGSTVIWQRGAIITYGLSLTLSYSSGTYIPASGSTTSGVTATLTVKLITYVDGIYDSEEYVDADSGYPAISNEPNGCDFNVTRTSLGTYTITAASRGSVIDYNTDATVTVKYTQSGGAQLTETETVSQEANVKTNTQYDEDVVFVINSSYTSSYSPADADETSWDVTASGTHYNYEKYTYTSTYVTDWIQTFSEAIPAGSINITSSGTGLSGSGTGTAATITWASRGTVTGIVREGTVTASYDGETDSVSVYQEANAVEYTDNKVITSVLLDGVNSNISIAYTSDTITVSGSGTLTEHYTSGATASGTFTIGASGFSVSGTGFSYSNYVVSVTENSGAERQGTVTAAYTGATSVQRTITQAKYVSVVAPTVALGTSYSNSSSVRLVGNITDNGGGTITACGFQWGYTNAYGNNKSATIVQSGEFSCQITGLNPEETIYFRAYATNSAGTSYSSGSSITTEGIVHGSITAAEFGNLYVKADVSILIYNDTFDSVNLGVITGYIKQGETTIGSAVFNSGSDIIISSGSSFSQTIAITTTGASELYIYYAKTSSIPQGVGILSLAVSPPPI
jgi:hypothetical protein